MYDVYVVVPRLVLLIINDASVDITMSQVGMNKVIL